MPVAFPEGYHRSCKCIASDKDGPKGSNSFKNRRVGFVCHRVGRESLMEMASVRRLRHSTRNRSPMVAVQGA